MTGHAAQTLVLRILRGAIISLAVLVVVVIGACIIAWDSDPYAIRDRFEHFKAAFTDDWEAETWCPPGKESETCEVVNNFEAALEEASDFTFFRSARIEGTSLLVQTGIRFATARDVVAGLPASKWCYVSIPDGAVHQQIELATQSAGDPPVYASLSSLDETALAGSGLSVNALTLIARSHCRFD